MSAEKINRIVHQFQRKSNYKRLKIVEVEVYLKEQSS